MCGSSQKQHRIAFKRIGLIYSTSPNSRTARWLPARQTLLLEDHVNMLVVSLPRGSKCQSTQELHLLLASRGRELARYTRTFLEAGVVNFSTCQDLPSTRSRQPGLIRSFACWFRSYTHHTNTDRPSKASDHCPPNTSLKVCCHICGASPEPYIAFCKYATILLQSLVTPSSRSST